MANTKKVTTTKAEDVSTQVENEVKQSMLDSTEETFDDTIAEQIEEEKQLSDDFGVKLIRASSKVSVQLNDVWYSFDFSETREVKDDKRINEIRADLWNTVNNEVDNQVQYTIDSILGKVQQPQNMDFVQQQQSNPIPEEYDY